MGWLVRKRANIALNGIESIYKYKDAKGREKEPSIRYADDMVIIIRPQDNADAILEKINEFLAVRGMKVSERKTKLTATKDGFNFLGWHFRVQKNGKFRSTPERGQLQSIPQESKTHRQ